MTKEITIRGRSRTFTLLPREQIEKIKEADQELLPVRIVSIPGIRTVVAVDLVTGRIVSYS